MSIMHEEHRKRLRDRFVKEGLQHFEPHNVLELLLFYAIPRKDTNEIAHRLMNRFGSLSEVLEAPVTALKEVEGIGDNAAVFLSMMPQLCNIYLQDRASRSTICGLEQIAEFASQCFVGMTTEHFLLICVDNKCAVINHQFISEGSVDSSSIDIHKMLRVLAGSNATNCVVAHNHPRGSAKPSRKDLNATLTLAKELNTFRIQLLDHVIVSNDGYLSMASDPKKYGCYLNI